MLTGLTRPLLMAHRGASAFAPENTLEAFDLAVRLGAAVLELDVRLSRDGEVVVVHDATLERTTNGSGRVRDRTYAELASLDAGYRFCREPDDYRFRGRGCSIPRLADVLDAFPNAGFNIELKQAVPSMVRPVLDVLEASGASRVVLAAADHRIMRELEGAVSGALPGTSLGLSRRQVAALLRRVYFGGKLLPYAGRALQVPLRHRSLAFGLLPVVTSRVIAAAHGAGIEVHLWTIDSPGEAARWLERGVDGIITNDPGALLDLFRERAQV